MNRFQLIASNSTTDLHQKMKNYDQCKYRLLNVELNRIQKIQN